MLSALGATVPSMDPASMHPVAALFPLLDKDDLYELTEDIKANGLLHPIVLDSQGRILDGRNRHIACEAAGVEPSFVTYDGDDPGGYALSVNIARRNLSKWQRAMIAAEGLFNLNNQTAIARSVGVSQPMIAKCQMIREHTPGLIAGVIAGEPGQPAYDAAAAAKKTKADEATRAQAEVRRVTSLRDTEPQLAEQVSSDALSLDEAERIAKERAAARRAATAQINEWLARAIDRLGAYAEYDETAQRDVEQFTHQDTHYTRPVEQADLEAAAAGLARLIELWKEPR